MSNSVGPLEEKIVVNNENSSTKESPPLILRFKFGKMWESKLAIRIVEKNLSLSADRVYRRPCPPAATTHDTNHGTIHVLFAHP